MKAKARPAYTDFEIESMLCQRSLWIAQLRLAAEQRKLGFASISEFSEVCEALDANLKTRQRLANDWKARQ